MRSSAKMHNEHNPYICIHPCRQRFFFSWRKTDNPCFVLFTRQCLKSSGSIRGIKVITFWLLLSSRMREPPVWELQQSGWSGGMKQPRCGTGGDKSGRHYFCRPLSRHGAHPYPRSLSRSTSPSTSLISAVILSLFLSLSLSRARALLFALP